VPVDPSLPAPLACPAPAAPIGTTYYVAINQPGADNDRCDGLSPVNAGGGHCPFKDFTSARTFGLLRGVAGVRVEVRSGVYTFVDEGLTLNGTGGGEGGRIVLTAYGNEGVVFDGRNILRELIRVSGRYVTLERVTVQHSGGYNVEVNGDAQEVVIQCTRFLANMTSDSLKGDGGAGRTVVRNNDFSQWDSQAIDLTNVRDWTIQNNDFHDSLGQNANALGAKFGTRNVLIMDNRFRNTRGLSFGGVSSPHGDDFEAYNIVADHNSFDAMTGSFVTFYSCANCVFRNNDAKSAGAAIVLANQQLQGPSGCAGGCRPTQGVVVTGNRFKDLRGGPGAPPNLFWVAFPTEIEGLSADSNLYCASPDAKFTLDNATYLSFPQWVQAVRTDFSSQAISASDGACAGW
jgi:Right handed beta helix region